MKVSLEIKRYSSKVRVSKAGILGTIRRSGQVSHILRRNIGAKTGSVPRFVEAGTGFKTICTPLTAFFFF